MTIRDRFGIASPLRRDLKSDFAATDGPELLASKVRQVLATEAATSRSSGELPWRTSFGSAVHLLRHQRNDTALGELARVYVREALKRWLPDLKMVHVSVESVDNTLALVVRVATPTGTVAIPIDVSALVGRSS